MGAARWMLTALALVAAAGCQKVPLVDINARFARADAVWFEEEETLFFFYRVEADQGLGARSRVELTWRTDDAEQPWAPLETLPKVHTHVPVPCGRTGFCGSTSLHVKSLPRMVGLRLRYHDEGEMVLDAQTNLHVIHQGAPHTNRSLVVYGVFDESNTRVQWRGRHTFPNLRNEEVQELGLRRQFVVSGPLHGDPGPLPDGNLYGYGFAADCPAGMAPLGWDVVQTDERALFEPNALPNTADGSPAVCATATVTDARGLFEVPALARKNPDVRVAFPVLRSPVKEALEVGFVLRICNRTLSQAHLDMQLQRLQLEGAPEVCIDDWTDPALPGQLAARFQSSLDLLRPQGRDMVLVLALHHDDRSGRVGAMLEQALALVLPLERDRSTPRAVGAMILDSFAYTVGTPELRRVVLWCLASVPTVPPEDLDDVAFGGSETWCAVTPDFPGLELGPFRFGNLPILPTRAQYLNFIDKYSEAQAGRMVNLTFRAPERTPISENVAVGDFGVATFFNGEVLTAEPEDAFSYCAPEEGVDPIVFRLPALSPEPGPLSALPELHAALPQPQYALGLFWDFPYLLRLEYEIVIAGAASAYGLTVPFGIREPAEEYKGTQIWETGEFPLHERLLQCRRFCQHPTFDSGTVYQVLQPFDVTYRNACYRPAFPVPGDGGFPLDP